MSSTSRTSRGDQSLSAMAAARGQMRESIVSLLMSSPQMQASPPNSPGGGRLGRQMIQWLVGVVLRGVEHVVQVEAARDE